MEIVVLEGIKEPKPLRQVAYIIMYIFIYGYICYKNHCYKMFVQFISFRSLD
jgi:hypothetical protein